jgi:hypothetical protein
VVTHDIPLGGAGRSWQKLAEALPCDAVDFVCICLMEAHKNGALQLRYFVDNVDPALRRLLRQVLFRMQGNPDIGANEQF